MGDPPIPSESPDIQAVRTAHRRYAEAFDGKSPDAVGAAFTDAGVLITSTGVTVARRAGLRDFAASWAASHADVATRHTCADHTVTRAAGRIESTCRATVEVLAADGTASVLLRAVYHDTLAIEAGQWRIARREVIPEEAH